MPSFKNCSDIIKLFQKYLRNCTILQWAHGRYERDAATQTHYTMVNEQRPTKDTRWVRHKGCRTREWGHYKSLAGQIEGASGQLLPRPPSSWRDLWPIPTIFWDQKNQIILNIVRSFLPKKSSYAHTVLLYHRTRMVTYLLNKSFTFEIDDTLEDCVMNGHKDGWRATGAKWRSQIYL